MNSNFRDKKLSKKDIGKILNKIGNSLSNEVDMYVNDINNILFDYKEYQRFNIYMDESAQNLDQILEFIYNFPTNEKLREFLAVSYKELLPFRLSKKVLRNAAIGTIITSNITLKEAKDKWEYREKILYSINIYKLNESELINLFEDELLFPDGYSIASWAKRYNIKLPTTNNKLNLIKELIYILFERPNYSRRIGEWGLREGVKKDESKE